jgi:cell division control protein 12
MAAMPFAVIGSEKDVKTNDGRVVKGRQYAWGVAEVEDEEHCDFKKLRSILIRTHMLDLIHTTEEQHYEAYRAQQMETRKFGEARPRKLDNPKFKEEEENLRKRFTEQVKVEESRFRQWEQKLIAERDRLNKDLEATHAAYVPTRSNSLRTHQANLQTESKLSSRKSRGFRAHPPGATAVVKHNFVPLEAGGSGYHGRKKQKCAFISTNMALLSITPSWFLFLLSLFIF